MAIPSGNPRHPLAGTRFLRSDDAPYPVALGSDAYGPVPEPDARSARALPGTGHDLIDVLRLLYPATGGTRAGVIGSIIRNNRPVADRQTLTMAARVPESGHGDYWPQFPVSPDSPPGSDYDRQALGEDIRDPAGPLNLAAVIARLYPNLASQRNSQTIGDRPVTTMTNPLPNYQPLTMVKGQAAAQLRTLINHALAQRGLQPLVNTPLPVGATQMGRM